MQQFIRRFLSIAIPASYHTNPPDYRKASFLVLSSILSITTTLGFLMFNTIIGFEPGPWINIIAIGVMSMIYVTFRMGVHLNIIAWAVYFTSMGYIFSVAHFSGGLASSASIIYPISPIFGFWIGNRKIGIHQGLLTFLCIAVVIPILESQVFPPLHIYPAAYEALMVRVSILTVLMYILLMLWISDYGKQELLDKIKEQNELLRQQENLASLGMLTAGVAHEVNNPINFINSGIEALNYDIQEIRPVLETVDQLKNSDDSPKVQEELLILGQKLDFPMILDEMESLINSIKHGVDRTHKIVQALDSFRLDMGQEFRAVDLNQMLQEVNRTVSAPISAPTMLQWELGELPLLHGLELRLRKAFSNIIENALEAVENHKNPRIRIITQRMNDEICVDIEDNGRGISQEKITAIFDPFFTDKKIGEGIGMGLYVSYGIIKQHRGRIEVESEVDQGTKVSVFLPLGFR